YELERKRRESAASLSLSARARSRYPPKRGMPLFELVGEQCAGVRPPREAGVQKELCKRSRHVRQPGCLAAQSLQAAADLGPALGPVELGCERADGSPLQLELAMGIAARGEQEHGAAHRRIQLVRLDQRVRRREQREGGPNVGLGAGLVQHRKHAVEYHRATVDEAFA